MASFSASPSRFGRRAAAVGGESLITTAQLNGAGGPLLVSPRTADLDLVEWAAANRAWVEQSLLQHGAVLFRGFDRVTPELFERFASSLCPDLFGEYGDLPREAAGGKLYSSTPYPASEAILFHNESSHLGSWPLKIWFYCAQPPVAGGETPIVDCRRMCRALKPETLRLFAEKKLMYVRHFVPGLDVSWQTFFGTEDKAVAEAKCLSEGIGFEWTAHGLKTRQVREAVRAHPKTGEPVFFNQVQLHHVSCLAPPVRGALADLLRPADFPRSVYYGDGSPIDDEVMHEVNNAYTSLEVVFPWQKGDILMVDNVLTAHGRKPYTGSRKILVALGDLYTPDRSAQ